MPPTNMSVYPRKKVIRESERERVNIVVFHHPKGFQDCARTVAVVQQVMTRNGSPDVGRRRQHIGDCLSRTNVLHGNLELGKG